MWSGETSPYGQRVRSEYSFSDGVSGDCSVIQTDLVRAWWEALHPAAFDRCLFRGTFAQWVISGLCGNTNVV